jgi:hypothetical protein
MPNWEFHETVITDNLDVVVMTLVGSDLVGFNKGDVKTISMICSTILIIDVTCPSGPYLPDINRVFPGGSGTFYGTSDAEFLTLIGSNPRTGSIAGPTHAGGGCILNFTWNQNSSTEPRAEEAYKLILADLRKLDTKVLKQSIKVLEDAKIRYSDKAEVHPPGIL